MINQNDYAYPVPSECTSPAYAGLTKRELFALQAMVALLGRAYNTDPKETARYAITFADALIDKLNEQEK